MRLSSLSGFTVLILSSFLLAQHHDTSSAPSAPAPSAPSHVSSPSPSPSPSPTPSPTHTSAPSPSPAPSPSHSSPSSSTPSGPSTVRTPANEAPRSDLGRVIPEQKISGESRIGGAPRIGENPPQKEKEGERKPAESDLRKHICLEGPCKEPAPQPVPPQSDLRKHICINGPCACPPGQMATKGGCVANVVNNVTSACQAGQYWNGAACQTSQQCQPGLYWNGYTCVMSAAECASLNARADGLIAELGELKARLDQSCGANPPAQDCDAIKLERMGTRQRYEALLTEGPARCAAALPPAGSFYDEYQ